MTTEETLTQKLSYIVFRLALAETPCGDCMAAQSGCNHCDCSGVDQDSLRSMRSAFAEALLETAQACNDLVHAGEVRRVLFACGKALSSDPKKPDACQLETYSGTQLSLLDPDPAHVNLEDIAHSLARENRFNGHSSVCYSVAEHSLHVLDLVTARAPDDLLAQAHAGLHDAAEAYTGDITAPMKRALRKRSPDGQVSAFDGIETEIMNAIWRAFSLPQPTPTQARLIKQADLDMLLTERKGLSPEPERGLLGLRRRGAAAHAQQAPEQQLALCRAGGAPASLPR